MGKIGDGSRSYGHTVRSSFPSEGAGTRTQDLRIKSPELRLDGLILFVRIVRLVSGIRSTGRLAKLAGLAAPGRPGEIGICEAIPVDLEWDAQGTLLPAAETLGRVAGVDRDPSGGAAAARLFSHNIAERLARNRETDRRLKRLQRFSILPGSASLATRRWLPGPEMLTEQQIAT